MPAVEGWEKLERHELTQELSKVSLRKIRSQGRRARLWVCCAEVLAGIFMLCACQWERPAGQRNSNAPG